MFQTRRELYAQCFDELIRQVGSGEKVPLRNKYSDDNKKTILTSVNNQLHRARPFASESPRRTANDTPRVSGQFSQSCGDLDCSDFLREEGGFKEDGVFNVAFLLKKYKSLKW